MQSAICNLETDAAQVIPVNRGTGVAIAGAGLISVFGDSRQTWEKLIWGHFISDHAKAKGGVVGLARDAVREAVGEAGWSQEELRSAGWVVGTSKGNIVEWIDGTSAEADPTVDPAGVGAVAGDLGMGGPRLTVSAACASGLLALIRGVLMIKSGEARKVLVAAAEASVHELFLGSFRRLGVLAKAGEVCRPFDEERSGFLMSEAGAAVCLEAAGDGGGGLMIERMAMGGDATHLIMGDERAVTLRALLADVVDGRAVDLIHAHGTGTVANDAMELAAIEDCVEAVGEMRPILYSHKGALGHSLGAAGLVSVVINRICHQRGLAPPGLGERPMNSKGIEINLRATSRRMSRSVVIAAGFGGAMGVVSLITP